MSTNQLDYILQLWCYFNLKLGKFTFIITSKSKMTPYSHLNQVVCLAGPGSDPPQNKYYQTSNSMALIATAKILLHIHQT